MAVEIERKFLLKDATWRQEVYQSTVLRQGYLSSVPERSVRVRLRGNTGTLTIKGIGEGFSRPEFEYTIPAEDAAQLLGLCEHPLIEKTRHEVRSGKHLWEIDEFAGANEGLVVAEIELTAEEEVFLRPDWLGEEVTEDIRYFNAELVRRPFGTW